MDEFDDVDAGFMILPGVDLALWLRIVVLLVLAVAALAIGLVVAG